MKSLITICIVCIALSLSGCGAHKIDISVFEASSGEPIVGGKLLIFQEGRVPSVESYWKSQVAEVDKSMDDIFNNNCSIMTSFINDIQTYHIERFKSLQKSDSTIDLERCRVGEVSSEPEVIVKPLSYADQNLSIELSEEDMEFLRQMDFWYSEPCRLQEAIKNKHFDSEDLICKSSKDRFINYKKKAAFIYEYSDVINLNRSLNLPQYLDFYSGYIEYLNAGAIIQLTTGLSGEARSQLSSGNYEFIFIKEGFGGGDITHAKKIELTSDMHINISNVDSYDSTVLKNELREIFNDRYGLILTN